MDQLISLKKNIRSLNGRKPYQFQQELIPAWFEKASVLILFWEELQSLKIVLTRRSASLEKHKGEVCFPGGKVDRGETFVQAALREAEEEIGLDSSKVEIIGRLDDTWSGASYHLVPVVGWYRGVPEFFKNDREVEDIIIFDLLELLQESEHKTESIKIGEAFYTVSTIKSLAGTVFGLSADLLLEVMEYSTGKFSSRGAKREEELKTALKTGFFAVVSGHDLPDSCK
ncbi:CoA pyrophosphatase [bacterium]|nr:CoA pyrophosphatase [bacterium]